METWEDGIQGIPSPEKVKEREAAARRAEEEERKKAAAEGKASSDGIDFDQVEDNVQKNAQFVRENAQELLQHTQDRTGIRSTEDLKELAAEWMKLATECLKEFMAGYRKGRDDEIDKMLHEYFQDEEKEESKAKVNEGSQGDAPKTKRKRRPRRAILR